MAAAATPEEFLPEDGFLLDPEMPFSPSLLLDLPPTPHAQENAAATADDPALDFISTMLMEDDIDDMFFYHYPDHPALLQAQQPYAQIISDGSPPNDSSNFAANSNPTGISPPPFDDASNSTSWSYDPDELSQLLESSPYLQATGIGHGPDFHADHDTTVSAGDGAVQFFDGQTDGDMDMLNTAFLKGMEEANKFLPTNNALLNSANEEAARPATVSAGDGGRGALDFFNGQTDGDIDMLNAAFLKGMEEAKKFLPTDGMPALHGFTGGGHMKKAEAVDGPKLMFGNGRGRKNKHKADYLEAESGRDSKVIMPEREETGAGEMFDEMMLENSTCMAGMRDLRISMGNDSKKNSRKPVQGKQSDASEMVDLSGMLLHCAEAVSTGDRRRAKELLKQIKQHADPRGDATQRLAHCFAEGLEARLAGSGSRIYRSLLSRRSSAVEYLRAYKLFVAACSFKKANLAFSGLTIIDALAGKSRLHIVDYGIQYGLHWPGLLRYLAEEKREGGPPEVRITGIDVPQPGFRPACTIEETGRRLADCARKFGLPFKFHAVAARWEAVRAEDLNLDPSEVLVVNTITGFGNVTDESAVPDGTSPRDAVLGDIRKMRPDAFIMCVPNGPYGAPFFLTRFRVAMFFYAAQFDMLDATVPRDDDVRLLIEREMLGRSALNIIACEGADRVERPETYKQWQGRCRRAGLRQLPLNPETVKAVRNKVEKYFHKNFLIDEDHRWLLQGWKGRPHWAMSTWVAEDDNSRV